MNVNRREQGIYPWSEKFLIFSVTYWYQEKWFVSVLFLIKTKMPLLLSDGHQYRDQLCFLCTWMKKLALASAPIIGQLMRQFVKSVSPYKPQSDKWAGTFEVIEKIKFSVEIKKRLWPGICDILSSPTSHHLEDSGHPA